MLCYGHGKQLFGAVKRREGVASKGFEWGHGCLIVDDHHEYRLDDKLAILHDV